MTAFGQCELVAKPKRQNGMSKFTSANCSVSCCDFFPQEGRDYRWLKHSISVTDLQIPPRAISGHLTNCRVAQIPGLIWIKADSVLVRSCKDRHRTTCKGNIPWLCNKNPLWTEAQWCSCALMLLGFPPYLGLESALFQQCISVRVRLNHKYFSWKYESITFPFQLASHIFRRQMQKNF